MAQKNPEKVPQTVQVEEEKEAKNENKELSLKDVCQWMRANRFNQY